MAFLERWEAALDTILPFLFLVKEALVMPPTVFSFLPRKTAALAILPLAILLTLFAFMAFMTFIVAFLPFIAFIAFIAFMAFMAFMAAAFLMGSAIAVQEKLGRTGVPLLPGP